jgi:hypothetical protein
MAQPKSAAQSLYPHLPSAEREPITQRPKSIADAIWPSLSREQKAKEAWQAEWEAEQRRRDKQLAADIRATRLALMGLRRKR